MPSEPPSRKRPLTAEEAELWHHAMRQAKELRRRERERYRAEERGRKSAADAAGAAQRGAVPAAPSSPQQTPKPARKSSPPVIAPPAVSEAAPSLAQFDERQRRKLARDTAPIEARMDLHGMRQSEAHIALRAFLRSCAAKGLRHVLVITGKGTLEGRSRDYLHPDERGVLRRMVPHWMSEPDLREIVVSYTTAHARHGGQGALYVHLRKLLPRG